MKVGILTFQFPYNYGALLQCCALKGHLSSQGHEVSVIPYYPAQQKIWYTINPFSKGIPVRSRVHKAVKFFYKYNQISKFENFKSMLFSGREFTDESELPEHCRELDALIIGSDQVWNDKITGSSDVYYGTGALCPKVAYAASLGSSYELSAIQRRNAQMYLPSFYAVSVREAGSLSLLGRYRGDIRVVCDPVFFLNRDQWDRYQELPAGLSGYVLLYMLEDNPFLLEDGIRYAKQHGLRIIEVNPVLMKKHSGIPLLRSVGPREFIGLVKNAAAVCSNSFHALAFSMIYGKTFIHIPNSNSPERTLSLLASAGIAYDENNHFYDLTNAMESLAPFIEESKTFLNESLAGITCA
ncbi:polysaccharide pyruvyl transferase family protein [Clostridiaceae bacterium]|nr:polysaccharide pyruvyl transferase family protein [Clostridiaceae bacterium]